MSTDMDNFKKWFVEPLNVLNQNGNRGFAVMMIAIGMLERYLREKSGEKQKTSLGDPFYDEFRNLFPLSDNNVARKFWNVFRHGLMHQATLKIHNGTRGAVSGAVKGVEYDDSKDLFRVNPKDFSTVVVNTILGDFGKWLAPSSPDHPTPSVNMVGDSGNIP